MILFVKNIDIEGPETIGKYFKEKGFEIRTVELDAGKVLPDDLSNLEAVIVLGGPMNVNEEGKYPFLKSEDAFIKKIISKEIPFIGICLGSQLLAKAAGASVGKSPKEEIGFSSIQLTDDGKADPIFKGLKEAIDVFQWHGDMFEIPQGAQLLASSDDCPHQSFRVGRYAYGLQFHVEITDKSIIQWSERYFRKDKLELITRKHAMLQDYQNKKEQFNKIADKIYENFLEIIKKREASFMKREG